MSKYKTNLKTLESKYEVCIDVIYLLKLKIVVTESETGDD